ncbi:hypothetical protein JK636_22230 [Clostridium sp. YIM B02515]|uniref:Uncharacterized protein n=1 Tax=Clostridium rhizosphaerae TaxID=2803861 RepID=A0ABS1TGD3_9CLOT|nr:hypothetical protein [Clostridium rhizosphaerae]MBL4938433.1 hypothetical protein [Clostridium rhizosphaerae]
MIISSEHSLVGENCSEYESRYILHNMSNTNLARNCAGCLNYVKGECKKGLFNELYESLRTN